MLPGTFSSRSGRVPFSRIGFRFRPCPAKARKVLLSSCYLYPFRCVFAICSMLASVIGCEGINYYDNYGQESKKLNKPFSKKFFDQKKKSKTIEKPFELLCVCVQIMLSME